MDLMKAIEICPHLASPAMLARADTNGKYVLPPHLAVMNRELMNIPFEPGSRVIVNVPYQHGKSVLASEYFPAWTLLLFPQTRILLGANSDKLAVEFGSKVKGIIDRWGPEHGLMLKQDTQAKGEWKLAGAHGSMEEGGMVCRGLKSSFVGKPCDLLLIDDPIKLPDEAISPLVMESQWNWYKTVVQGRIRNNTSIVIVMTRWSKMDLCGRIIAESKQTGEKWKVIKFKALAEEADLLGRKPGEALWPAMVSRRLLEERKASSKWFGANYQQEPPEEEGAHFRPRPNPKDGVLGWPQYSMIASNAWSCQGHGEARRIFLRDEIMVMVSVDWAFSVKKSADFSAIIVFGLTPDCRLLILDVVNRRLRLEQLAPEIAAICRIWRPSVVSVESGHPSLRIDIQKFPEIPEPRWVGTKYIGVARTDKLHRAIPAIFMAENGKVYLPDRPQPWLEEFLDQVSSFTGNDEHDDMVDALAQGCYVAQQLRVHVRSQADDHGVLMLTGPKDYDGAESRRLGVISEDEMPWTSRAQQW